MDCFDSLSTLLLASLLLDPPAWCHVGARVASGEADHGTVRWVGSSVPGGGAPAAGVWWVGVAWDAGASRTRRAKHRGTVAGETIFLPTKADLAGTTDTAAPVASFVRAEKLRPGVGLLAAARSKLSFNAAAAVRDAAAVGVSFLTARPLKEAEDPESMRRLVALSLSGSDVEFAEPESVSSSSLTLWDILHPQRPSTQSSSNHHLISDALPALRQVDISGTLIDGWGIILPLLQQLPELHTLDISFNHISPILPRDNTPPLSATRPPSPSNQLLKSLLVLNLNSICGDYPSLTWSELEFLLSNAGNLQELSIVGNSLGNSKPPTTLSSIWSSTKVKNLSMQNNHLTSWKSIWPILSRFPCLEVLSLSENDLDEVVYSLPVDSSSSSSSSNSSMSSSSPPPFPVLTDISLEDNSRIASQSVVVQLNMFPSLKATHLKGTAIMDGKMGWPTGVPALSLSQRDPRATLVAMLPRLQKLNGAAIRPSERSEAENLYFQDVMRQLQQHPSVTLLGLLETAHPMLRPLSRRYEVDLDASVRSSSASQGGGSIVSDSSPSGSLSSQFLQVQFSFPEKPPISRKMLRNITVEKLLTLIRRALQLDASSPLFLAIKTSGDSSHLTPLSNSLRQLDYYLPSSSSTPIVEILCNSQPFATSSAPISQTLLQSQEAQAQISAAARRAEVSTDLPR